MQKADKETIKKHNKQVILSHLKKSDFSRSEIAALSGLSNSTVSSLVAELADENIIFEKSVAKSSGGRKPIILSINPDAAYAMLIKIIRDRIIIAIVNLKLQIVYEKFFEYSPCNRFAIDAAVCTGIGKTFKENKIWEEKIAGVGVSISGMVDHSDNNILYSAVLNLRNYDIKETIKSKINKGVYVFKDTDASLLGEDTLDSCSSSESYLYLFVGTGVGLSFMNKGEIMQLNQSGFEIGHVKIESSGPQCNCGKYGCVESFLSEQAALRDLKFAAQKERPGCDCKIESLNLSDIVTRANDGDSLCMEVVTNQCKYLGRVAAMAVNFFAPNQLIVGGPLGNVNQVFAGIVANSFLENVLNIFNNTQIRFTSTGDKASFMGMAQRIFEKEFYIS